MKTLTRRRPASPLGLGRRAAVLVAAVLFGVVLPGVTRTARAQVSCTSSGPSLNLGTINPYSGYPYSTSGNVVVACTNSGSARRDVYVCLSVGVGTGGTTASNRTLVSGANKLPIRITSLDPPTQVGTGTAYPMSGTLSFGLDPGQTFGPTFPLTITVPAPGSAPPPGPYTSSFSGVDAQIFYTSVASGAAGPNGCTGLMAGTKQTAQADFSVSGTVPAQCTVSAGGLAFPTRSVLSGATTATATVTVTCNAAVPVTVALDNGATGSGPTARRMRSGANAITYGIYRDAGMTQPWGSTAGTDTASLPNGTGTLTAYGRVPAQTGPAPGSYSDVVNVTITY